MPIASACSILPCSRSSRVIRPPARESEEAVPPHWVVAPGQDPGPYAPSLVETCSIAPPQGALQTPFSWLRCQNSQSLSVLGCQTTRWRSLPAAGSASGGSGTAVQAAESAREVPPLLCSTCT